MTEFKTRLSRVRMKGGGADIRVLHREEAFTSEEGEPENLNGAVIRHAKKVAEYGDMDGFIVLGFFPDGSTSLGYHIPDRIPVCLLPGYVEELVRRDTVTDRKFHDLFEWKE